MTPLQLELTRLIGKKETYIEESPWSWQQYKREREIPATLSELHRWMNEKIGLGTWHMDALGIFYTTDWRWDMVYKIPYDSSKDLLNQDEETLKQIISIINQ